MTTIKERPILFSAPMVRAILEGRKTVTRREVKKRAALDCLAAGFEPAFLALPGNADLCPYGKPGDRLWVRETFAFADKSGSHDAAPDDHWRPARPGMEPEIYRCWYRASDGHTADGFWKPSIHMPRWASRILLEITDVRVERLQDITEKQALAEGIVGVPFRPDDGWPICTGYMVGPDDGKTGLQTTAAKAFAGLWDSVGGNWNANPWVWVVEFKRVTP
ncbi:hypothetical protein OQ519_25025 [Pseudomonas lurida]|uniref:hypothetical protein n=1 Tax=Pseudomonas lurida TaxID=244566 RepID=UPI00177F9ABE|nr:hypothetical protein [Pseudomonas lurida]MBD8669783.1 hypothetical protein [Pseudomonas lurida]UZQ74138.1 hypothetical protein OQ519_25025 [Pseudomonas lurida]